MMQTECSPEFLLIYIVGLLMCISICIPPVRCRFLELVWGEQNHLSVVALHNLKFFSMVLSHSSASIGSTKCENVGGLVLYKSPTLPRGWGCSVCWWPWPWCILAIICCIVWSIWACIIRTCSKVGGGGRLFSLLALVCGFLVLTIWRIVEMWDKMRTQKESEGTREEKRETTGYPN
jgi:hypothetical protein